MPVPETAMHEYRRPVFRENDVGLAGQVSYMETEAITRAVKQLSKSDFRTSVLAPDAGHVPAAARGRNSIGHCRRSPALSSRSATMAAICLARYGGTAFPT